MSEKLKIGISVGDINGIGLEVIIKSLMDNRVMDFFTPIVYGNTKVASFHRKAIGVNDFSFNVINSADQANSKRPNMINCWQEDVKITLGEQNEIGGKYAFISLEKATEDLKAGLIDALVTAPINKHNIQQEGFNFPGHTEYLQAAFGAKDVLMFMVSDELRVGVVTGHIPVKEVASSITEDSILHKLRMMNESLKKDFWIQKPKIAVLGLNPHAGDDGLIGTEDKDIIRPAIEKANEEDIFCFGPFPADGFFAGDAYTKFDAVLAMYHDQGLIPFKHIASRNGINFTAGLPVVRTSPDHGTGYDIAGKNLASHASFLEAIFEAVHIVNRRREQEVLTENPLAFRRLSKDRD
ncbi:MULTISPECIES: 4-hydroxythreonine-4-phosphate dehydrogenase PdxA [Sphingobacterium]|uniref:4-hydroxythreonine-4-phosphate dehydrogenase n=1 Tax=Sphingobacterium cellulitidis TaxID=1768011 RepID=A0A8H9FYQ4_9SPHI|nr:MULTISPECIES: 4-hydroxythreonine-4-phosphate dehydrogenase PdxA [Sphingobacterium]MBA8985606.1 4-hydroxythreonine-4-phosphate dehydrogenase [Sphingobacterium soli]WFB64024.1 4-hydroxythreonine-4-phosphate dehydrogenase PdxA [Sphingobacterium sp. WM]GGE08238.1 4-hydroxythreonine-4-phosphate dehydrogenase [Sphingobacterium soli]